MFKLADDWLHRWWRLWSMRVAAAIGCLTSWAAVDPNGWHNAVDMLPEQFKPAVGVIIFGLLWFARGAKQPALPPHPAPPPAPAPAPAPDPVIVIEQHIHPVVIDEVKPSPPVVVPLASSLPLPTDRPFTMTQPND